jgi:predicted nucleic acid-binding Zn ribbon protein
MEAIKDIVSDLMRGIETRKSSRKNPEVLLKKVLSKKELGHVKFRYLRSGTLGLTVDSSGWLYHLNLQKQELLSKLAKKSAGIKDIRFCIGETK